MAKDRTFFDVIGELLGNAPKTTGGITPPQPKPTAPPASTPSNYTYDDVIDLIKQFEGFRTKAYKAPEGKWTIGYGSTGGVKPGMVVDQNLAQQMLMQDLQSAYKSVDSLVDYDLNNRQRDALASLIYNIGPEAFKKSKARQALNMGKIDTFLKEAFDPDIGFTKYTNPETGKKEQLKGLVRRRLAERDLFLS